MSHGAGAAPSVGSKDEVLDRPSGDLGWNLCSGTAQCWRLACALSLSEPQALHLQNRDSMCPPPTPAESSCHSRARKRNGKLGKAVPSAYPLPRTTFHFPS